MSRTMDSSGLSAGFPAELFRVPGDPGAVRGSAQGYLEFGVQACEAADDISSLDTSLFIGPEATVGGFFAAGADRTARALLQGSGFLALGVGEHIQLEVAGNIAYAAGSPSLGLGGGVFRALVRF